jgi:CheY-like chemotaxis protein
VRPVAKILIADDEAPVRQVMALACRMDGHEVREAFDTPSTIALYESFRPDLLVLDLYMPGGGGGVVLRNLRQAHQGRIVPVVVVSGYLTDMAPSARENLNAAAILEKPFRVDSLRAAIREALEAPPDAPGA